MNMYIVLCAGQSGDEEYSFFYTFTNEENALERYKQEVEDIQSLIKEKYNMNCTTTEEPFSGEPYYSYRIDNIELSMFDEVSLFKTYDGEKIDLF